MFPQSVKMTLEKVKIDYYFKLTKIKLQSNWRLKLAVLGVWQIARLRSLHCSSVASSRRAIVGLSSVHSDLPLTQMPLYLSVCKKKYYLLSFILF